jgi:hypothetical protein
MLQTSKGHAVAVATSQKVAGSVPMTLYFSIDPILPAALWPCGRLSL